jgi:4-amino-4-deoxy-L-arabinose transferase-like glycosyltransferase
MGSQRTCFSSTSESKADGMKSDLKSCFADSLMTERGMLMITVERNNRIVIICLLLCASFLLLTNLGNHYLWQDEAETALLGKSVLAHGLPYGTDGKNFFSQQMGAEYGHNYLWRWNTWLPLYMTAGSFALLGAGTLSARLPFALFGIATVFATYLLAHELWNSRRVALLSAALLTFCVPFLILCRQCRYYSLSAFFAVIGLYFYARITRERPYAIPLYLLSFLLLFQSNYVHAACLLCANLVHSLFTRHKALYSYLYTFFGALLIVSPWLIWLSGINYNMERGGTHFQWDNFRLNLISYCHDLYTYVLPLPVLALLAVCAVALPIFRTVTKRELPLSAWSPAAIPFLFVVVTLAIDAAVSPAPFFRYLTPVIPAMLVLAGFVIDRACIIHPVAWMVPGVLFITIQPLPSFYYELTHDYNGPVGGIVKFLKANAKPGDTVAITYEDLPLKFYTPLRVIGGMTGEDLNPALNADWVIIRKYVINPLPGGDLKLRKYLLHYLNRDNYQPIRINSPDIPFENRESLEYHQFRTAQDEDMVVIFKKISHVKTGTAGFSPGS